MGQRLGFSEEAQRNNRYLIQSIDLQNRVLQINKTSYAIRKKIGSGAFGSVYSAHRLPIESSVAIKVFSLGALSNYEAESLARSVLNEIEMSKRLSQSSRHVVKMFDFDFHRRTGLAFLVMELGENNFETVLAERGRLSSQERLEFWRQLVEIAMTLHKNNIVHLDIKPENLVVFPKNRIKLVDLGIAQKSYQQSVGRNGTWLYSAPEVTNAHSTEVLAHTSKADVWSWGAVLYRMTYQRPPRYHPPCHYPPEGQQKSRDPALIDVLRRTLVLDPKERVDTPWLTRSPYTARSSP